MFRKSLGLLAILSLSACGEPQIEIQAPFEVVNFTPAEGAVNIDPAADVTVCFSREMDVDKALGKLVLEEESGTEVESVSVGVTPDPKCLSLGHPSLKAATFYVTRALAGLESKDGAALGAEVKAKFKTQ